MQSSNRRHWIKSISGMAAGSAALLALRQPEQSSAQAAADPAQQTEKIANRRIRQSVAHWCFNPLPIGELAAAAAKLGILSIELVGPEHWPVLKEHNLTCAITGGHGFDKGFAHREEWAECHAALKKTIDNAADFGCPNVITFSGFRRQLDFDEATRNMVAGLKEIVGHAEEKKITLCLEMLNSRVAIEMKGHPDYFCDHIDHTIEIVKQVGSPRLKALFDIYHVQIMDGDVISRIREHKEFIGHYHTAGNPGRHELDELQELNYPAIMKAIAETGYQGYVGQEFIPRAKDAAGKIAALAAAVRICDVA